ncbi:hypothetical protein K7C81_23440, partial [Mycobacterium avium]|uniref:hypothetical protein n=1 Tax=Mycobacterium avium TaxID=1764 RepID=UPI002939696A
TAAAFSSALYRRVVGFPGDCSFGIPASSFPRSGASGISRAFQATGDHQLYEYAFATAQSAIDALTAVESRIVV